MEKDIEIKLPKLGESIMQATIIQWFKQVGDLIELDEPLLEVATDKVNSEIPSPVSGRVKQILARPEEQLDVGAPVAVITTTENIASLETKPATPSEEQQEGCSAKKGAFSPVVLRLAREQGIELSELENIPATGAGGRLSKRDLEGYLKNRKEVARAKKEGKVSSDGDLVERMKITPMRKMIADKLVRSFYEAPHATLVIEVDMSFITHFISEHKESFLRENGYKLSVTSFIAQGIARAVQEYPLINASLEDDMIVLRRFVHLGIAVSVEQGIFGSCDSKLPPPFGAGDCQRGGSTI